MFSKLLDDKNNYFLFSFLCITAVSLCEFFMGGAFMYYFHPFFDDSFMDLFCMVSIRENGSYPPFIMMIYKLLHLMQQQGSVGSLRLSGTGSVMLLANILFFSLPLTLVVFSNLNMKELKKWIFTLSISLSGIVFWSLERGNCIIYSFLFTLIFVILYNKDSERYKLISCVFLILAVSIKLYPAVFGAFFITKKDIRAIAYCVLGFSILYIVSVVSGRCFDAIDVARGCKIHSVVNDVSVGVSSAGIKESLNFFKVLMNWAGAVASCYEGINFSLANLVLGFSFFLDNFFTLDVLGKGTFFVTLFLQVTFFALFLICFFRTEMFWKKTLFLSLLCIYIPNVSFQYSLLFLIIPLVFFIQVDVNTKFNKVIALLFGVLFSLLVIPGKLQYKNYYVVTYSFIVLQLVLLTFSIMLVVDTFRERKSVGKVVNPSV